MKWAIGKVVDIDLFLVEVVDINLLLEDEVVDIDVVLGNEVVDVDLLLEDKVETIDLLDAEHDLELLQVDGPILVHVGGPRDNVK